MKQRERESEVGRQTKGQTEQTDGQAEICMSLESHSNPQGGFQVVGFCCGKVSPCKHVIVTLNELRLYFKILVFPFFSFVCLLAFVLFLSFRRVYFLNWDIFIIH